MKVTLEAAESLPVGEMRQYELDGKFVLVCHTETGFHAVDGVCPHRGAQLALGSLEGSAVVCPWHDWAFDAESGCGLTNPNANLQKYSVEVVEGQIVIEYPM